MVLMVEPTSVIKILHQIGGRNILTMEDCWIIQMVNTFLFLFKLKMICPYIMYQKICEEIRNFTDLPIKIKEHPTLLSSWPKVIGVKDVSYLPRMMPIGDAVKNAKVVVAINSNSCVDSLIAGKPVINLDEGSMTWDIAERDFTRINLPPWPDRSQWCNNMAYCNWNPEDLRKGEAWEVLKKKL